MLGKSIGKNSLILATFAFATAGVLGLTFAQTKDKIAQQEKAAAEKALFELVPPATHDNNLLETTWTIPAAQLAELGLREPAKINIAFKNNKTVALLFPSVAHDGYNGDIKLLVAVWADGSLAGVRTLSHKETPGLGDKVDIKKSNWILGFNGLSLTNPDLTLWKVKKDGGRFDQFTGATITPRATVKQVKASLEFFQQYHTTIIAETLASLKQTQINRVSVNNTVNHSPIKHSAIKQDTAKQDSVNKDSSRQNEVQP